jgi:hypothetical protein
VNWHARPLDCREQPLLEKVHHCHPCQVNCVRVTREDTILKEGTPFVLRKLSSTAAATVLLHTLIVLAHGTAHTRLKVGLPAWANLYVVCVVGIGPIAGLLLLRSSRQRSGATILFATMVGALVFGLWKHFIVHGPDHVMHLQPGGWGLPFQTTAVLLAVS